MCSPDRWRIEPAATARGSRWVRPKRAGTLRVIYVPDPAPGSVFVITAYRTRREGPEGIAAAAEAAITEEAMKKQNRFPQGWNEARVQRLLAHYERQSDTEAVAEDEAAYRSTTSTVMKIPVKLVPAVRALLAKRRAS